MSAPIFLMITRRNGDRSFTTYEALFTHNWLGEEIGMILRSTISHPYRAPDRAIEVARLGQRVRHDVGPVPQLPAWALRADMAVYDSAGAKRNIRRITGAPYASGPGMMILLEADPKEAAPNDVFAIRAVPEQPIDLAVALDLAPLLYAQDAAE